MCPPPSCPSHDFVFASSNNNTTSDNGNNDYNSCTQPMAQRATVSDDTHTTTTPQTKKYARTPGPRGLGNGTWGAVH